jgi:hypothetical protein
MALSAMRFQCDRCGKRYRSSQDLADGMLYKHACKGCGNVILVLAPEVPHRDPAAPPASSRSAAPARDLVGSGRATRPTPPVASAPTPPPMPTARVTRPTPRAAPTPTSTPAPPPAAPASRIVVTHPRDLPPPTDGYVELMLDDDLASIVLEEDFERALQDRFGDPWLAPSPAVFERWPRAGVGAAGAPAARDSGGAAELPPSSAAPAVAPGEARPSRSRPAGGSTVIGALSLARAAVMARWARK